MLRGVEDPGCPRGNVGGGHASAHVAIYIEREAVHFPIDREDVVVGIEDATRQSIGASQTIRVAGAVDSTVAGRRFLADVFDRVHFAARRPGTGTAVIRIVSQVPEGGERSLRAGELDARLPEAVGVFDLAASLEATRGVIVRGATGASKTWLVESGDDQVPVTVLGQVVCAAGHALDFSCAKAPSSDVYGPKRGTRLRVGGPVEFVTPEECPTLHEGHGRRMRQASARASDCQGKRACRCRIVCRYG